MAVVIYDADFGYPMEESDSDYDDVDYNPRRRWQYFAGRVALVTVFILYCISALRLGFKLYQEYRNGSLDLDNISLDFPSFLMMPFLIFYIAYYDF